jgi:hypothetical protein
MNKVLVRAHQRWTICVVALLLGCTPNAKKTDTASSQHSTAPVDIQIKSPKPYPFSFVAYGDMRYAERERYGIVIANAKARQQVVDQIAVESPAFLVIAGDFVFRGFHAEDWTFFDRAIKPVRDRGIQIFPAIGNHEVGPFPSKTFGGDALREIETDTRERVEARGLENYWKEFPEISQKRWYSARYANCYFLVLDSELDDDPSNAAQDQWIKGQLDAMPAEIDYIFVVLHRPPYTAITGPVYDPRPAQIALRKSLEARQPASRARIIVIAGHVHNYERYEHGGVQYIVSGGGGAAPAKFPRSPDDRYPNPQFGKNDPNEDQYHYCRFTVDHSRLKFEMMKLVNKGTSTAFEPRDSIELDTAAH